MARRGQQIGSNLCCEADLASSAAVALEELVSMDPRVCQAAGGSLVLPATNDRMGQAGQMNHYWARRPHRCQAPVADKAAQRGPVGRAPRLLGWLLVGDAAVSEIIGVARLR
jgi:hypothetical protein